MINFLKTIVDTYCFAIKSIPSLRIITLLAFLFSYISLPFFNDFISPAVTFDKLFFTELIIDNPTKVRKGIDQIYFTDATGEKHIYTREMNTETFNSISKNKHKLAKIYYSYEHNGIIGKSKEIKHLIIGDVNIITYNYENELHHKNQSKSIFYALVFMSFLMFYYVYIKGRSELIFRS